MKDSLKIVYLNQIILVIWYNVKQNNGENLHDNRFISDFLDTTPKAYTVKEKTEKLDCIKIGASKGPINKLKRQPRQPAELGKIF